MVDFETDRQIPKIVVVKLFDCAMDDMFNELRQGKLIKRGKSNQNLISFLVPTQKLIKGAILLCDIGALSFHFGIIKPWLQLLLKFHRNALVVQFKPLFRTA